MAVKSSLPKNCKICPKSWGMLMRVKCHPFLLFINFTICIKTLEYFCKRYLLTPSPLLVAFFIFLLIGKSRVNFYGRARLGRIFQLGWPCSLGLLLATWLTTRHYFPCEDCSISLVTTCFHLTGGIMCPLAIRLPI